MNCGKDSSIFEETQTLVSINNDLRSISDSQDTVCLILINIRKILTGPLMTEQETLREKIEMYFRISKLVLESYLATTNIDDNKKDKMLAKLRGWNEAIEIVETKMLEYMRKTKELTNPSKEEKENGGDEIPSDMNEMTEKERKRMVKSYKDREMFTLQRLLSLEDLKAEWDSEKFELDTEMMVCLQGIASLKESP